MNELALFAGAGGGILGGHLLGWRTVCAVEWEPYAACVLAARQNDGLLPSFPIWDDVQTFDGRPWRGIVDVISGGFPCQDISVAGKGDGLDGERSGMWREMARIIHEVRPRFVFVENSPMLTSRGLHRVLGDLAEMGFDARWGVLGASSVGANHKRERIWIVANSRHGSWGGFGSAKTRKDTQRERPTNPNQIGRSSEQPASMANFSSKDVERQRVSVGISEERGSIGSSSWWSVEPNVGRVADGVAARVDRLKAIGNGQVSEVARRAWEILSDQK
jgi:DNA (cytosine-5)-methyltransferase 1